MAARYVADVSSKFRRKKCNQKDHAILNACLLDALIIFALQPVRSRKHTKQLTSGDSKTCGLRVFYLQPIIQGYMEFLLLDINHFVRCPFIFGHRRLLSLLQNRYTNNFIFRMPIFTFYHLVASLLGLLLLARRLWINFMCVFL